MHGAEVWTVRASNRCGAASPATASLLLLNTAAPTVMFAYLHNREVDELMGTNR